jgi:hypothetical protein
MTLVSSGDIHLKGSSGAPTRSICFELYGVYTGVRNLTTMAIAASIGSPYDITEFYNYSACSDSAPSVPTGVNASWAMEGRISITFTVGGDVDNLDFQCSTNNSFWETLYNNYPVSSGSPFTTTVSCSYLYYRCRAKNCAGDSSWGSSSYSGSCP